jgi:hypothetical protein
VNRRTQGRVKQARRRAQKRADIRAGRRMSLQQFMHNTHSHDEPQPPEGWDETATGEVDVQPEGSHMLVRKDIDGEEIIGRGTEYAMRKQKREEEALLLNGGVPYTFSVRKVKVTA